MKLKIMRSLAPLACVALVACHIPGMKDNKAPTGQVIATVDGEEITLAELRAELAGAPAPANAQMAKAVQEAALRQIIIRKIMAKAAHDQGLDKSPDFAVQKQRANQNLLAQALERQLAATASTPSQQEAEIFVREHPGMFAERKVMVVDQIRMQRPKTQDELKAFMPLKSLGEFETVLTQKGLQYQRSATVLDTGAIDPAMVEQIEKVPAGEPFMFPQGNMILVNQIRDSRVEPFTGPAAVSYAMGVLRSQRVREAMNKGAENLVKVKADTVKYNDAYKPSRPLVPPPGAAKPAASPAPAAASPAPAAAPAAPAAAPAKP